MKRKIISLITAVTMLMSLMGAMPLTAQAYAQVTLYYTNGDAVTTNKSLDVRNFISGFVLHPEDWSASGATVDVEDRTICSVQSVRIEKDNNDKQSCKFSIVPQKVGKTTITVSMTFTYAYGGAETFSQEIPILVKECSNHNVVQGEITDSYNLRSCSACYFREEKPHTYNANHICTVCGHQCSHSSTEYTKDASGHSKKCVDCKAEIQSQTAHTYTDYFGRSHICSECEYLAKHTYNENHICTVCNLECSHSINQTYQTATGHYKVCNYCGRRTDNEPHTYAPKSGDKTYHYCSVCSHQQSHSFGAYVAVGDIKVRDCEICKYRDTGEYRKPPHSENDSHSLCNNSSCTDANHKLPTTGTNKSWNGAKDTSTLLYYYQGTSYVNYSLYNIIKSGTTLTSVWEFPDFVKEKKLYNCLDGNRLTFDKGAYIHIKSGQTYSVTDCRDGMGEIGGSTDGVIKIDEGGTFNLFEGTITGNGGDGIIVNNGTMNLYGGSIINNTGAAIINNGTLNIYGGTITGNTGGGIIGTGKINFRTGHNGDNNIVIANNTIDGALCNVKGASTISVAALGDGASVGFTPSEAVTAGSPKDISASGGEYYSRFVSDSDNYEIIKSENKIQIVAAHSVLEHHAAAAPTCTENGTGEYWSCAGCDRLYSDADGNKQITAPDTVDATGHSLAHHEATAPTCTEAGTGEYWKCETCKKLFSDENGTTEIETVPTVNATGHNLIERKAQAATCTESGITAHWECEVCGKLFSDANGTTEITEASIIIAPKGHTWGDWEITKPATSTETGTKTRTCSVCNATETQDIPVLGHTHTMKAHKAVAATCTENGAKAYWECTSCNKLFLDENGTTETTLADTVITAKGHTPETDAAVAATCTKGGKTEGSHCSVCGTVLKKQEDVAAAGHKWGDWETTKTATETEDGEKERTCSACNETETQVIPATGHTCDWGEWEITTEPTLTETGKATHTCTTNAAHTESVDLPVLTDTTVWTEGARVEPTETTDGSQVYISEYGNVTIVLPATGADKFSIRYEDGKAIVTVPTAGTYSVLFAAYDTDGRLTSLKEQTVTFEKGETAVTPIDFTADAKVKVMLWESLSSMKPL